MAIWLERPPAFESDEQANDFLEMYALHKIDEPVNENITNYMFLTSLYRMKLANVLWFEGEVSEDSNFPVHMNPDIPSEEVGKYTGEYVGQPLSYLRAMCKAVEPPDYVTDLEPPFQTGRIVSDNGSR